VGYCTSITDPTSITIAANASDSDGSIAQIAFYSGATPLGTDTTAHYAVSWNNVPPGSYALTPRATNNDGAIATSSVVNITVNQTAGTSVTVIVKAESGSRIAPMAATADAAASGGQLVEIPEGTANNFNDATKGGPGEASLSVLRSVYRKPKRTPYGRETSRQTVRAISFTQLTTARSLANGQCRAVRPGNGTRSPKCRLRRELEPDVQTTRSWHQARQDNPDQRSVLGSIGT